MGETKFHGADVLGVDVTEERGELSSDSSIEVVDSGVGENGESELLGDGTSCSTLSQSCHE